MFSTDLPGFRQNLPPAVLAGGLGSQHRQSRTTLGRGCLIGGEVGKQEVGLVIVFGDGSPHVPDIMRPENCGQMMFQRMAHAGFPAVLDAQRKADEAVYVGAVRVDKTSFDP